MSPLTTSQERRLARTDPAMFMQTHSLPIFIDEVQYAPELFSYIKIAIDNGAEPGAFWLTGSQTFRLMELAQESLAGRVAILHMTSLSQHEIYGTGNTAPFAVDLAQLKERRKTNAPADMKELYERIWKGSMPGLPAAGSPTATCSTAATSRPISSATSANLSSAWTR